MQYNKNSLYPLKNIQRKLKGVLAMQLAIVSLFIIPMIACGEGPSGLYIKASAGGTRVKIDSFGTDTARQTGFVGQLAIGGSRIFSNGVYLGAEIFGGRDDLSVKNSESGNFIASHLVRQNRGSLGAAVQAGYAWGKDVLYGRLGLERMFWKRYLYDTDNVTGAVEDPLHQTIKPVFVVPGIGWRHSLTESWSVNAEYQHALPKRVKKMTGPDKPTWSFQRLLVGVSYHF